MNLKVESPAHAAVLMTALRNYIHVSEVEHKHSTQPCLSCFYEKTAKEMLARVEEYREPLECGCVLHTPSGNGIHFPAGSFEPGSAVGCKVVKSWRVCDTSPTKTRYGVPYRHQVKYRDVCITFMDGTSIHATEVESVPVQKTHG